MRIAFVGKGGSGKTTLAALFTDMLRKNGATVIAVDADINMHLPELLGCHIPSDLHLSLPHNVSSIKTQLAGGNSFPTLASFRKTTPPTRLSKLLTFDTLPQTFIHKGNLKVGVVGTYTEEEIGTSCYHNNLAIFENILSHLQDHSAYLVADMVAGVDAFANTLHAQFDMLMLLVEPTQRSVEVWNHYHTLSEKAGTHHQLFAVGNKVRSEADEAFLKSMLPPHSHIGTLHESEYLRTLEREGGAINYSFLESENQEVLQKIFHALSLQKSDPNTRLKKLWELHESYVAQPFIKERFGDLRHQIDREFRYDPR